MSCSVRTNESKILNWYDFVMPYVIITFRRVIFSDASTSGFKSELILRSLLQLSWQFSMLFFKVLMWNVFTRCKIVLWYRFRQNENWKLLRCEFIALLPLKFILTSFVKRFSKIFFIKSCLFCDFSEWKHVRTIATCKKKTFLSRKVIKTMFCYFWKIRSQSNDFYRPFRTFAIKVKII